MATAAMLKTPPTFSTPAAYLCSTAAGGSSVKPPQISFTSSRLSLPLIRCRIHHSRLKRTGIKFLSLSAQKFSTYAANGETAEAETETQEKEPAQGSDSEPEIEGDTDGTANVDGSSDTTDAVADEPSSVIIASLNLYKEALANNDDSKVTEVESFLKSIEEEKVDLERKVANLSEELQYEKDRVLRISADFDNFRKRTERDRLSQVSNARGEVLENLLPVLDNFERAKAQIKVETEGEEKITNSYQSICKQFVEILVSLGVVPVETVGKPFDPMLHEAIMREDSAEYEEGVVIEEFRKGFQLGERLLRPSMVKVSAGPGPAKGNTEEQSEENAGGSETSEEGSPETTPTEG
ncbi:hypothetical protein SASPL_112145 [Salvia splendens]|uniref:GrpE protein homolog n=1 Tax=Salvia splendens TaxID=180675 RepID=A0A8X8Y8J9_SALSN|nr:protein GrpE-like isoform X1 [Salvia splendens]KAG6427898.1 hypothetical protein SASPL_112145 [Salvia splendens]